MNTEKAATSVGLHQIFLAFCNIGAFSFGGGISGLIHREIVHNKKWLSDTEMLAGLALAQVVPGANVANTCVYVGQRLRGVPGAAAALLGLLCIPFFATVFVYLMWDQLSAIPMMDSVVDGVAAAAVGLNLRLAMVGAQRSFPKIFPMLIMAATIVAVGVLRWPIIPVMAVLAPLSIAYAWPRKSADA